MDKDTVVHIYILEYYSPIKNEIMKFRDKWIEIKKSLSKVTQTNKDMVCIHLHVDFISPSDSKSLSLRTTNHQALPTEHSNGHKDWLPPLQMQVTNLHPTE